MRVLLGFRLAVVLLAIAAAAGCGGPTAYRLKVDSVVTPFKPADPDDLVVDTDDDDDEDDDKSGDKDDAGEE